MASRDLMAPIAILSLPVAVPVGIALLQAAPSGIDVATFWAILTAMGGSIVALAGWSWKQREKRADAERALATSQTELAVCQTKLSAYGKSAPELADEVRRLGELFAQLIEDDMEPPSDQRRRDRDRLPFPYGRSRPTAPRRQR